MAIILVGCFVLAWINPSALGKAHLVQALALGLVAGILFLYAWTRLVHPLSVSTREARRGAAKGAASARSATAAERSPRANGEGQRWPAGGESTRISRCEGGLGVPLVLLAIVTLALVLRTVDLTGVPFGFFCDEASNGLDAYDLLHTLHDQHGAFLPVFFQALGDWRGGLHIYLETPFVLALGLNEFTVRLCSAVEGTLTVLLTYVFVTRAVNRPIGLMSAFLLAISPWHLIWSRTGFEYISFPLMTALSLCLLHKGLERPRWLPFGILAASLGVYTYQPARLVIPMLLLVWFCLYLPWVLKALRYTSIGFAASLVVLLPCLFAVHDGTFFARASQLSTASLSLFSRVSDIWSNYQTHFSPSFLFDTSTGIILRHYVRGFGMLYGFQLPFLLAGAAVMLIRHRRCDVFFLAWVLLYPLSAAIVSPAVSNRSIAGVIVLQVLTAQGAYSAFRLAMWLLLLGRARQWVRYLAARLITAVAVLGCLSSAGSFMHAYLVDYPHYASGFWGWQAGPREVVDRFKDQEAHYDGLDWDPVLYNGTSELWQFFVSTEPQGCVRCRMVGDITKADVMTDAYSPAERILWAVPPNAFEKSELHRVPYRVLGDVRLPDNSIAYLFVATGPGTRRT